MSEVQSSQPASAVAPAALDASCRFPLLLLFFCAACWAVVASAFALIASIKFHSPSFLAGSAWLTYGRVRPAYLNCLLYGFCVQAGLGVALWLLARLGQTRLAQPWLVVVGTLVWNAGVKLGVAGILWGDGTGFEYLDMPGYAAWIPMLGYLLMGLSGVLTFHQRQQRQLFASLWFILAALFWFPWIYATGELLLVTFPVRGAAQVAIWSYCAANLQVIWLPLIGLSAIFYFIPKLTQHDLHSRYLALFAFWMLILCGGWTGIGPKAPLPAWMPAISTVTTMLLAVPLLAVGLNLHRTLEGKWSRLGASAPLHFIGLGTVALLLTWLVKTVCAGVDSACAVNLTWLRTAQAYLNECGFFALVMFGSAYAILPRLIGTESLSPRLVRAHFRLSLLGVLLTVVPLAVCGIVEARRLHDSAIPFMAVAKSTLPFLRASTMGDLLLALGNLVFLFNIAAAAVRFYRPRTAAAYAAVTADLSPIEAKP
jgi:cytochrome c oxidase cbb3-type subunit I